MKIGIEISSLWSRRKTGIGWSTYQLIENLKKIDKENHYILFTYNNLPILLYFKNFSNMRKLANDNFQFLFLPQFFLKFRNKFSFLNFNVIHLPDIFPYLITPSKLVVTIHDITPIINPNWFTENHFQSFLFNIKRFTKTADKILVNSCATKKDLVNYLKVDSNKITVVYLGTREIFKIIADHEILEKVKKRYGINKKYLLCVATIEPRKNHIRLLNTFVRIKKKISDYQLVICGKIGWKVDEFFKRLKEVPEEIKKDIIITHYVSSYDLPFLYNGSDIFVYPSLYEGFGLPILEAMRCGVPVITSNVSSMPEVAGDAALLINPEDEEEIADAILRLVEDRKLRENLIKKGLERSKLFTWENTAKQTLDVYKELS